MQYRQLSLIPFHFKAASIVHYLPRQGSSLALPRTRISTEISHLPPTTGRVVIDGWKNSALPAPLPGGHEVGHLD